MDAASKMIERRGLESSPEIVDGRWFEPRDDGVIEVVTDEIHRRLPGSSSGIDIYEVRAPVVRSRGLIPIEIVGALRAVPGEPLTETGCIPSRPFSRSLFVSPRLVLNEVFLDETGLRPSAVTGNFASGCDRVVRVHRSDQFIKDLTAVELGRGRWSPIRSFGSRTCSSFRWFHQCVITISLFLGFEVSIVGMVLDHVVLIAGLTVEKGATKSPSSIAVERGVWTDT